MEKFVKLEGLIAATLSFRAVSQERSLKLRPLLWTILSRFLTHMIGMNSDVIHFIRTPQSVTASTDNFDPPNETPTAGRRPKPTTQLLESEKKKRATTVSGKKFRSRVITSRLNKQADTLKKIATDIYHGTKNDLIHSLAVAISRSKTVLDNNLWNGELNIDDITSLTKLTDVPNSSRSLYEQLTKIKSAEEYYLSAEDILFIKDQSSSTETFRILRRKFPGFFASEAKEDFLRKKWHNECKTLLNPQRTATGWKIDVNALCQLLRFRYYWLPEQEWWCLYIDARNYGGSKTCTIELSILNNEAILNDVGFHSPDHYWPVHLMYGDDSRENLDLNLGGSDNYLNSWVSETQEAGHNVYLSADSVCMDSILGNGLVATSTDKFNAYNYETVQTRSEVGTTGFRSGVNREICREHPESLLPALPTEHLILCSNHMMSRVTEHLVKNTILSVLDEETNKRITAPEKEARLQHFVENINSRGVRSGQFKIKFDGNKLEPITLNTTHAETISSPPELIGPEYRHIIDNVISDDLYEQPLPRHLQEALNLDSPLISKKELEKIIWDTHWKMHVICRKDPDPRLRENVNVEAYRFGLEDAEICEYQ